MRYIFFLTAAFLFLIPSDAFSEALDRSYRKTARQYGFRLDIKPDFPRLVTGERISVAETESELERFFAALSILPPQFIKKSGISRVMICRDLRLNREPAGGVASGDCIYLNYGFSAHTVYHELFHTFDKVRQNRKWTKLNNRRFHYSGSPYYPQSNRRKNRKRQAQAKNYAADFVSMYAQSFEWEDRAETFAAMICEGGRFLQRVQKSPVLRQKMLFIIDMTSKRSVLNKEFWDAHLRTNKTPSY